MVVACLTLLLTRKGGDNDSVFLEPFPIEEDSSVSCLRKGDFLCIPAIISTFMDGYLVMLVYLIGSSSLGDVISVTRCFDEPSFLTGRIGVFSMNLSLDLLWIRTSRLEVLLFLLVGVNLTVGGLLCSVSGSFYGVFLT